MNEENRIKVGRKYAVYQGRTWIDGARAELGGGCCTTFAVVVLKVEGETTHAVDGRGAVVEVPTFAYGANIPWVDYLPGAVLVVGHKRFATVKTACDTKDGAQVYVLRTANHRDVTMTKRDGVFRYGAAQETVEVRRAW